MIEFGPTYGVGVDKDGYVYEWGQLTKNLKKIPADMGKVVDICSWSGPRAGNQR